MTNIQEELAKHGGTLRTDEEGRKIVAFGSVPISQKSIGILASMNNIFAIVFYYCTFEEVDFSILESLNIQTISILFGNFGDEELLQFQRFSSLKSLKLLDTKVTKAAIQQIKQAIPSLQIL